MAGNYFDAIAEAIFKQKQRMDALEAENRELRRLLADLRAGHGIVVVIEGVRFTIRNTPVLASSLKYLNLAPISGILVPRTEDETASSHA